MFYLRKNATFFASFLSDFTHLAQINVHKKIRLVSTNRGNVCFSVGSAEKNQTTIGALFEHWRHKFEIEAISEPVASTEHIVAHVLGTTQISDIYKLKKTPLTATQIVQIDALCSQRLKHVPVQYILGEWSFRHLTLKMSPPVFIPRPETEQLVDIILPEIVRKDFHILDLCCGSGAIALSLLQEQDTIKATGVDQSEAACQLTKENAQRNGLNKRIRIIQSQLERWSCEEKFDLVVSNPPYVFTEDMEHLQKEIKLYEDPRALDGGAQGLSVIKTILSISSRCLDKNGKLFLEVDPRHPPPLSIYLLKNNTLGLAHVETYPDFSGKRRFVQIIKK